VRRIDPSGIITTIAGTGARGFSGDGGPAVAAQLASPSGVDVDSAGDVYIADWNNQRVRRVDSSGRITSVAGTATPGFSGDGGPAIAAELNRPIRLVHARDDNLYIADYFNARVRRVDPSGKITTVAGTGIRGFAGDGGPASAAQLSRPVAVTLAPDGSLYILDEESHQVRKVNSADVISTVAGGR
jgi:serine/threonine-protein kinase